MMKKKEKKKEKKKRKRKEDEQEVGWPSPLGAPCAPPPPGMAYPNGNPLQRCSSFSTTPPPPLISSPLHFPLWLPPSLLPFQIYSCHRPLPDRADGGEEMAESSGRRRGDGGIEQTAARRRQNQAESTQRRRNRGWQSRRASKICKTCCWALCFSFRL